MDTHYPVRAVPASVSRFARWLIVPAATLLSACATVAVTTPDGERVVRSRDEFNDYVETVFRYQNRVTDELIAWYVLSDAQNPGPAVAAAEDRMVDACQHLNALVMTYIEGRNAGIRQRLALIDTISDCEYATRDLEGMIGSLHTGDASE